MNEKTRNFISQHRTDDVRQVALSAVRDPDIDLPFALDQIRGWQVARRKIPTWAATKGLLYPTHLSMEQCSSEVTARYKASRCGTGARFVDLTGGLGVDFSFMSSAFNERIYVERNDTLCDIARQNFALMGLEATVVHADAEDYLQQMDASDVVFLDPARRDSHGDRTYGIADCTPNVLSLLPLLRQKTRKIILKLSPMLDWHKATDDLGDAVSEVHIISVNNECKELLFVLEQETRETTVYCVNDNQVFSFSESDQKEAETQESFVSPGVTESLENGGGGFLYEPNASIMKAGCFNVLAHRLGIDAVAPNSHLFLSSLPINDFPGRSFSIEHILPVNRQALRQCLPDLRQANITVRNFPESVATLRKRLKLTDGGDTFLFATTLRNGSHRLFVCKKVKS